ncbi:hypothetical protein SSAG_06862 [Streptomyces sp. Mg1]|nr:hypothetical protein SSAG_06862 [Streptomyces sp. Mg1]
MDKIAKALKPVHTAPTENAATSRFLEHIPGDRPVVGERLG